MIEISPRTSFEQMAVYVGVDTEAKLLDVGAMEWTYNRMVETALRRTSPFDVRVLITHFTAVAGGEDVQVPATECPLF